MLFYCIVCISDHILLIVVIVLSHSLFPSAEMKETCWKGLTPDTRPRVWQLLCVRVQNMLNIVRLID